ncbi:hypothetical protein LTR54_017953 [Friedmanniomyces endolithicus]|nr:hypothetical protein LTR54_017953 [Friedmanniomyces endolithicus]
MTDRFARTDGSTTAACNLNDYCGGTWQGLINRLDYIQGMGFTAVWISPVVKNLVNLTSDGNSYHGYWAQDIYSVNTDFGSATDLVALSSALHARGMYLMVDVVTNHMGYAGCGNCVQYDVFNPFNSQSYYHPFCIIDYNNATSIQQCWEGDNIVSLPDLRTEDQNVLNMWNSWIAQLVSNYTIDGLRIDSFQQVDQAFWPSFLAAAGDMYTVGEVFNGDPKYMCPYQQYSPGLMNYPAYYVITQAFQSTSGSIGNLVNGINEMTGTCSDTTLLGSFLENHDNPRFPSLTPDISLVKNAIGFAMLADGIPIVYQGQEQHFSGAGVPNNREAIWTSGYSKTSPLYTFILRFNLIRKVAIALDSSYLTYKAYPIYSDSHSIVMRKGSVFSVFTNLGISGSGSLILPAVDSGFKANQLITELTTLREYRTDPSGDLAIKISGGLPLVFYPTLAGLHGLLGVFGSTPEKPCTTLATMTRTSPTACATPTSIAVTFQETASTVSNQTLKLVGSISQLGSWNTADAVPLTKSTATSWAATLDLAPGTAFQYKYVKVMGNGTVIYEADPNHSYTVAEACGKLVTIGNLWQNL